MKKIYLSFIIGLIIANTTAQTTIHCPEAGKLKEVLTSLSINPDTLTQLKLTGIIDARDFRTLWGNGSHAVGIKSLKFIDLSELTAIEAYEGIGGTNYTPINSTNETSSNYKAGAIPEHAFRWSSTLEEIILPPFTTAICDNAFWGSNALKFIEFPESVIEIGDLAFRECTSLESIQLPSKLQKIGYQAFFRCLNLESEIHLPKTVEVIGGGTFTSCNSIPKVELAEDNPYFVSDESGAIYTEDMYKLVFLPPYLKGKYTINASTREITNNCGQAIEGLRALTLPDTLNLLSPYSFADCINLRWIDLKNIKSVLTGWPAFSNCPFDSIYVSSRPEIGGALLPMHFGLNEPNSVNQQTCKLFVPQDSLEVFSNTPFWKDFSNIIGVKNMTSTPSIEESHMAIYPNPAVDHFFVQGIEDISSLNLYDSSGKLVFNKEKISDNESIFINTLTSGVYIVEVICKGKIKHFKISKI